MHLRKNIHLALPRHDAIRSMLLQALQNSDDRGPTHLELTNDASCAEAIVTDSTTFRSEFQQLPHSVRFVQLIDCGASPSDGSNDNLIIANSSSVLAGNAADWAILQCHELTSTSKDANIEEPKVAGIVGFGSLGLSICERLKPLDATIWINDIRTPRQQSFQPLGARRSSLDMLLSLSDIVFVAVHHGPTSDPLLSIRELSLLSTDAAIVNLSGRAVVDVDAIEALNSSEGRGITYREIASNFGDASVASRSEDVSRFALYNLNVWVAGGEPRSTVENVSFPSAGDPAFWASRMAPKQMPS